MRTPIAAALVFLSLIGSAQAGTVTAVGAVTALTDVSQVLGIIGTANFDEGPTSGPVPLNQYSAQGLTWVTGSFQTILPGVTSLGTAPGMGYGDSNFSTYFPGPITGGGSHVGQCVYAALVATFSGTVTQVGLTPSSAGAQFLTVWDKAGKILGQVNWVPSGAVQFIGIDTKGTPIGMVAYGNDDVWKGVTFDASGTTTISDTWVWAAGKCSTDAQCDDQNVCTTDVCDTTKGTCGHTNNTLSCTDGNSCTQNDVCSAGACVPGAAVTCAALDGCHTAGVCNPMTGVCSNPNKADGSACSDTNACTKTDTCQSGVCTGQNPVVCPAPDACHTAGSCNMQTGMCTNPAKADGTACDDSNACTATDVCQAGICTGQSPVACPAPDSCHSAGLCDTVTGTCSNPAKDEGSACDDGTACTQGDTCIAGTCTSGPPVVCAALDKCHEVGTCDMTTGQCTNPLKDINCSAKTVCEQNGVCDPSSGVCINAAKPDGIPCGNGICIAGTCSDEAGNTTSVTSSTSSGGTSTTGASTGVGGSGAGGAGGAGAGGASGGTGVGGSSATGISSPSATSTGNGAGNGDGTITPAGGCGCSTPGTEPTNAPWLLLGLLVPAVRRRRKGPRLAA